jgi:exonuclease VII large subunit
MNIDYWVQAFESRLGERIGFFKQRLEHLKDALSRHSLDAKISHKTEEIASIKNAIERQYIYQLERLNYTIQSTNERLQGKIEQIYMNKKSALSSLCATYEAKAPQLEHKKVTNPSSNLRSHNQQ